MQNRTAIFLCILALLRPCTSFTAPSQHRLAATPPPSQQQPSHEAPNSPASPSNNPPSDWMTQCCGDMHLRQMFLPGSHDTGTYMWTTPTHMPLVLDEILSVLFNIVGDLSRTQHLDAYQ